MENQILNINLTEKIFVIGGTVVAAYNSHANKLFVKEGYNINDLSSEFKELADFETYYTVGHFGLTAFSFHHQKDIELTDFI